MYEVEAILGERVEKGEMEMLVLWKHHPVEDAQWRPLSALTGCPDAIQDFYDRKETPSLNGTRPMTKSTQSDWDVAPRPAALL
jgi:hypothetical protein